MICNSPRRRALDATSFEPRHSNPTCPKPYKPYVVYIHPEAAENSGYLWKALCGTWPATPKIGDLLWTLKALRTRAQGLTRVQGIRVLGFRLNYKLM